MSIVATKNGHDHEFSETQWEKMGNGNTRMGWSLKSGGTMEPIEVTVLKKKKKDAEETVVDEVPVVVVEETKVEEVELKKASKKKK